MEAFFRGSQTINFVTCGFKRSYSQAAEVPSSNVTYKSPRSPSRHCRIVLAFVSMTHSITNFPVAFITATEMLSLCTSIPIYLVLVIKGVLSGRVEPNTQNPTPKGAPFYIASEKELSQIVIARLVGISQRAGHEARLRSQFQNG